MKKILILIIASISMIVCKGQNLKGYDVESLNRTIVNNILKWGNDTIHKDSIVYVDLKPDSVRFKYINGTWTGWFDLYAGGVTGPDGSTDKAIVRFYGTTGKLVQNTGVTVNDNNVVNINSAYPLRLGGGVISLAGNEIRYGRSGINYLTYPVGGSLSVNETNSGTGTQVLGVSASGINIAGEYKVNDISINTAGVLSNVAYLNQANTFTNIGVNSFAGNLRTNGQYQLNDANTYISEDGSGNLTLADAVVGSKTLVELIKDTLHMTIVLSDETTNLETGTSKKTFRFPTFAIVTGVFASVNTAPSGSPIIVDINEDGVSILSTKLSIDANEKISSTAAVPAVISGPGLAQYSEITCDIDQVGATVPGTGLKLIIYYVKD